MILVCVCLVLMLAGLTLSFLMIIGSQAKVAELEKALIVVAGQERGLRLLAKRFADDGNEAAKLALNIVGD